jgi:hypothetical protein
VSAIEIAANVQTWPEMVRAFGLAMHPERCCPRCTCCTRDLCEAGQVSPSGCIGLTEARDPDLNARITACPCAQVIRP